jgi:hypothetical protein
MVFGMSTGGDSVGVADGFSRESEAEESLCNSRGGVNRARGSVIVDHSTMFIQVWDASVFENNEKIRDQRTNKRAQKEELELNLGWAISIMKVFSRDIKHSKERLNSTNGIPETS